jgi:hypothetical protein
MTPPVCGNPGRNLLDESQRRSRRCNLIDIHFSRTALQLVDEITVSSCSDVYEAGRSRRWIRHIWIHWFPVAARLSTSSTEPFSLNRKLEMIDDDALTTQKLRPSLSKEIQQELVEVFVGPVVIWLLVGISNDIGQRKAKPLSSNVDTEPVWNWLSDAASPSARNSRDSVT